MYQLAEKDIVEHTLIYSDPKKYELRAGWW